MITIPYPVCAGLVVLSVVVVEALLRRQRKSRTVIIGDVEPVEPCPNCGSTERLEIYGTVVCKDCRYPFEE